MIKRSLKIGVLSVFCSIVFFGCSDKEQTNESGSLLQKLMNGFSDTPSKLSSVEYMKWIEDAENGIKVNKTIGNFTYSALYKPYEYLALIDLKKDSPTKQEVNKVINEYNDYQYFTFRITANDQNTELLKVNLHSEDDYYSRIEYFSFKMQNDLKLIEGTDTLNCVMFHFERIYGLAPYATFVIGFPLTKAEEQNIKNGKKIVYNDKTIKFTDNIFGAGNVYINMKAENLNRIPKLELE